MLQSGWIKGWAVFVAVASIFPPIRVSDSTGTMIARSHVEFGFLLSGGDTYSEEIRLIIARNIELSAWLLEIVAISAVALLGYTLFDTPAREEVPRRTSSVKRDLSAEQHIEALPTSHDPSRPLTPATKPEDWAKVAEGMPAFAAKQNWKIAEAVARRDPRMLPEDHYRRMFNQEPPKPEDR